MAADFDVIYELNETEELPAAAPDVEDRFMDCSAPIRLAEPVVVRGAGNFTVFVCLFAIVCVFL